MLYTPSLSVAHFFSIENSFAGKEIAKLLSIYIIASFLYSAPFLTTPFHIA